MKQIKIASVFVFAAFFSITAAAQGNERDHIRRGNKLYNDSLFVKAEVEYRKALDANPGSTEAMYNLGNALLMQQKAQDAMKQYEAASKIEKNKAKLAKIYHNAGVILQAGKQYSQCIEAYKQSLRNNPNDDETRYNLALAKKMLKDQQQQQQNQQNKDKQENKKDEQEQQQKKEQEQQKQKQDSQQQQQQQQQNQMSKENAEQLLNAVMQDEKDVQEKVKKQLQMRGKKYDKDW